MEIDGHSLFAANILPRFNCWYFDVLYKSVRFVFFANFIFKSTIYSGQAHAKNCAMQNWVCLFVFFSFEFTQKTRHKISIHFHYSSDKLATTSNQISFYAKMRKNDNNIKMFNNMLSSWVCVFFVCTCVRALTPSTFQIQLFNACITMSEREIRQKVYTACTAVCAYCTV